MRAFETQSSVLQRAPDLDRGDNLRRFECHSKRGGGNGLTNQNRLGTLPIPSQTVSDTIDMAFWD
jgi:hypothetical protein